MPLPTEEGADSSAARIAPPPAFFSLRSHRLIVCLLLLLAIYSCLANNIGMSTAVVCMVNSSILPDDPLKNKENGQKYAVKNHDSSTEREFAIPGRMAWSPSQQSLLLSARFYGGCITVAFSGFVADRFGPDLVLTVVLILSSAITLAAPLLSSVGERVCDMKRRLPELRTLSFMQPSVNCIAARWFPREEKPIAVSIYSMGNQLAGLSSLFAASLCRFSLLGGWPSIFYVFGGASCIFTVFWIVFGTGGPTNNRWVSERERKWLDDKIKLKMKGKKFTTPITRILSSSPVQALIICNISFGFSTAVMQSFNPLFLRDLGLSIHRIGWYSMSPFISQIAGKAVFGPLIAHFAGAEAQSLTSATQLSNTVGSFGSSLALLLMSVILNCTNAHFALYILIAYGLMYSGCLTATNTSILSLSPPNIGTISSLSAMSRTLGTVTCTTIVNALTATEASYKWTVIFAVAAFLQCISGIHFQIYGTTDEQSW